MNKKPLLFLEQAFAAIALMLYSGGPLNVILSGGVSQGEQSVGESDFAITRYLFLLSYVIILFLLAIRWKKVFYAMTHNVSVWAIVGFAGLSVFWSDFPQFTIQRTIALVGTSLFGLYLATRYTPKQQLQILGWGFGLIVLLSLVYGVAMPRFGIMGGVHAGAWRGIYTHKNVFGKIMTLSSTVFLLLVLRDRRNRLLLGVGLLLSIALMLLSESRGAIVNLLTLIISTGVCQIFRLQYQLLVILLGTIVITSSTVVILIVNNLELLVVDVLGKDLTFTGRTSLWEAVTHMIEQRPWLGYGYQAFWRGWDSAAAYVWRAEAWPAPDSHNGFLDLTVQLGLVGLAIFLVGFVVNAGRSLSQLRTTSGSEHIWPVLYMIYMILSNLGETSLLKSNDIFWVLYVTLSISMLLPVEDDEDEFQVEAGSFAQNSSGAFRILGSSRHD